MEDFFNFPVYWSLSFPFGSTILPIKIGRLFSRSYMEKMKGLSTMNLAFSNREALKKGESMVVNFYTT
jgi:hypothetical protein